MSKLYYVACGSVRGCCGHKHKYMHTAQNCAMRDQAACASLGGGHYSDRSVWAVEDGHRRELTPYESTMLDYICQR